MRRLQTIELQMKKEGSTRDELIAAMHATTAKVIRQPNATELQFRVTMFQVQVVEERAREELARQIQVI